MHLIDDINLVFALCRRIGDLIYNLTDTVHAIIGCRINFDDIHAGAACNRFAGRALSTGTSVHRMFTVYRSCKNFGNRGFTCSASAAEQVSMSDPSGIYLVFQGGYNVILPLHILKTVGAELTI